MAPAFHYPHRWRWRSRNPSISSCRSPTRSSSRASAKSYHTSASANALNSRARPIHNPSMMSLPRKASLALGDGQFKLFQACSFMPVWTRWWSEQRHTGGIVLCICLCLSKSERNWSCLSSRFSDTLSIHTRKYRTLAFVSSRGEGKLDEYSELDLDLIPYQITLRDFRL